MESKNSAESAKLIMPLFVDGKFNRDGKRMRAKHVKDISCDGGEYSLWISSGSKENDYPRAENDTHYLYALIGEYIVPCGVTEYKLEQEAGFKHLIKAVYGTSEERKRQLDVFYKNWEESRDLMSAKMAEENAFIEQHGKDGSVQAEYLKKIFDGCVDRYISARDTDGKHADFIGAAILGELTRCREIADVLREKRKVVEAERREETRKRQEAEDAERKQKEQNAIMEAETILRDGGKITSGEMLVKIADKHGVTIPIRTRGWILKSLAEFTINGSSMSYRYWKTKNGQGSDKVYDVVGAIRKALTA